jgi:SAM-dependent methyltransferase
MAHERVQAYYASFGEREWARLENPDDGTMEFAVTRRMLEEYLPLNSHVLDIGGGPGRYSIWLAQHGHRVVLADLSPQLLSIARAKIEEAGVGSNIEEIIEADACNPTRWGDNSFDAVLSLGPFYHLPEFEEREQATAELGRVLRPGGLAFVSLMPVYALLWRTIAISDERRHITESEFLVRLLEQGIFFNDIPGRFTYGYGVRPEQVCPFFEQHGFKTIKLLAAEGIAKNIQRVLNELEQKDPALYRSIFEAIIETANHSSILGAAGHLLYIGKKE